MFRGRRPYQNLIAVTVVLSVVSAAVATGVAVREKGTSGASTAALRVIGFPPLTWDPAHAGDSGSASTLAQVFEGLTTLNPDNTVEPALAESWTVDDAGLRIDFKLRPNLRYSDGSAITAQDVVDCWLRLLDPAHPSPLVSLLSDVTGATDYTAGRGDRAAVGFHANGDRVVVDLARPAAYFVALTSSPSLAVLPAPVRDALATDELPANLVVSGAYRPMAQTDTSITLERNANYWAGVPAISPIDLVIDTGDETAVDMFEAGDLDYTPVGSADAAWIRFDRTLGPQLRTTSDLTLHYYGFDTTRPPFNDPLVRRAFGEAVDWDRIVRLAGGQPAHSMVPVGIPGGGTEDYRPQHNPDEARALLAQAGFAGGANFPDVSLVSNGYGYELAVATELERELGVTVAVEVLEFAELQARQAAGVHSLFWDQTWVADYPQAHDFLGLLLQTGSVSNDGRWSNAPYDAEISAAAATNDPAEQARHYAAAQAIVREEVPTVPVEVPLGYALSRSGLLGALPSGEGFLRLSRVSWADGSGR